MKSIWSQVCMAVVLGLVSQAGAVAQSFPTRPVKLNVTTTPATAADIVARLLGQRLTESWGQAVVIENQAGAAGSIGAAAVAKALKKDDWNEYLIRCEGKRIQTFINDVAMIDYTEPDAAIPQWGLLGLQIHGGGPAEASYKDISIEELP